MDLRDLWRPGTGITVRWVITHLLELPDDSRTKKHIGGDKAIFGYQEHLLADLRDLLLVNQYFTAIAATKGMKDSQHQKVIRGMPNRVRRPGDPEPEAKRFATPEELSVLFPSKKMSRSLEERRKRKLAKQLGR